MNKLTKALRSVKRQLKRIYEANKVMVVCVLAFIVMSILAITIWLVAFSPKRITCTLNQEEIKGIKLNERVTFTLKKNFITNISLEKNIKLSGDYAKFDAYQSIIKNHLESSYNYIDEKDIEFKSGKNKESVTLNINKGGIVLNNLSIKLNNPDNKYDIQFNSINNLDALENVYKIKDEYKAEKLIKNIEKAGYKCN